MAAEDTAKEDNAKRGQVPDMKSATETKPNPPLPEQGAKLEPDLQAHIGRQLRAVYDEVVEEGVPERFSRLLDELERKTPEGV
jgi:hypothetical protein